MSGYYGTGSAPTLATGGTGSDLSATGGAGQVLKQSTAGGAITVGVITASEVAAALATLGASAPISPAPTSGTNTAGSDLLVRAGAGTGTGASGTGRLQATAAGSSGSTEQSTWSDVLTWSRTSVAINVPLSLSRMLEVVDSTAAQQRWTHTASTKYAERQVDTNGYVYETATGNRWYLAYLSDTTKHLGILVNSSGQAYLRASGTEIYLETDGGTNGVQITGNSAGLTKLTFGKGFWLKGGSSSPSLLEAGTGQYVGLSAAGQPVRLAVDATGIGFYGSTPVAKQTLPTALTDSTGGSASDTLAAITTTGITDTVAQDAIIALKNAVASLAAKINGQRTTFIATTLVS